MQIVPGNALSQSISGSAANTSRTDPHVQAAVHGKAQAAGAANPGKVAAGGDVAAAQRANHIERPIPSEPRANAAPGSVIDIRV